MDHRRKTWVSLKSQQVENSLAMQETQKWVPSLGWEEPLEEENGNPFQYSCLNNSMNREAWWVTVHGVTRVGHD